MELKEVKELLDNQEPVLGDDYFIWYDDPIFPPGRNDLCVVCREATKIDFSCFFYFSPQFSFFVNESELDFLKEFVKLKV